jgi:hypothetical protein
MPKKTPPEKFKLVPNAKLRGALKDLGLSLLANAEVLLEGKVANLQFRIPKGRTCFRANFKVVRVKRRRR